MTEYTDLLYSNVGRLSEVPNQVEFSANSKKERKVIEAWKEYFDLFCDRDIPRDQWVTRKTDLFVELLYQMAQVVGYRFDRAHLRKAIYLPMAHTNFEEQEQIIRSGLVEVLEGRRAVSLFVTNLESTGAPPQEKAIEADERVNAIRDSLDNLR